MTDKSMLRRQLKSRSYWPVRIKNAYQVTQLSGEDIVNTPRQLGKTVGITSRDAKKINALADLLRRIRFEDYLSYAVHPGRMIVSNLLAGMAKGFGFAIGFTVLAFIAFYILRELNVLQLPYIGDFIADLLEYIESVKQVSPY